MANSRIRKKKRKQSVVIYDEKSLPDGFTFKQVVYIKNTHAMLIYSSKYGGHVPTIWPKRNTKYFKFKETL